MLLPQEHTVMVRQTSRWGQIFLMALVTLGAGIAITSWTYRLDEVITVQGILVPQKGGVSIKSPISGRLEKILIKNGDKVEKGDALIKFNVQEARGKEKMLKAQITLELSRLEEKLKSNIQRQSTLERNIELNKRIIKKMLPLEKSGAISEIQILQRENQIRTQEDEQFQLIAQRNEIQAQGNLSLENLRGELNQITYKLKNEYLNTPISGTVFDIKPDNNNYVVTSAETLMKIVPTGGLGAKVNITNKDIGFIKKGLDVKVRVDSFPYTEYGELDGTITNIGADALPPDQLIKSYHFPVNLKLNRSVLETRNGTTIPLQAGMTVTTNLKLRDRRLIELISDIFTDKADSLKRLRMP